MSENNPFIDGLTKVFNLLNDLLFDGKLENVPITIQTKKKVTIRWFPELKSIVIGSDITKLEFGEIPGVLLHEMIHVANNQAGLIDVTTNQYHNKNFLAKALSVGLVVIKHKTQGWAITGTLVPRNVIERVYLKRPTTQSFKLREDTFALVELDRAAYKVVQAAVRQKVKQEKPAKTYFLKYQCNCSPPHNSIRSGRRPDGPNALNIQCMSCRSHFECVTDLESEN